MRADVTALESTVNNRMSAILGVSGLAESVRFKPAHWPGLDEREYRILQGFDAAAALVVDGQVVAAAAEERFNRNKQTSDFPVQAIADLALQVTPQLSESDPRQIFGHSAQRRAPRSVTFPSRSIRESR